MRCVGDQVSVSRKDGTAKISAILDVHTHGSLFKHDPHLIGDGCNSLCEHFTQDRINGLLRSIQVRLRGTMFFAFQSDRPGDRPFD